MTGTDDMAVPPRPFTMARTFNATRARVWHAWSEAERLQQWWGPKGCRLSVARLEFRPGGFFHYAMQFSNGPPMWGRFVYREIVAPERLQYLSSFSNEGCGIARAPFTQLVPLEIENTVTFEERGAGQTVVSLRAVPHGATEEETASFQAMFASLEQGYGGTLAQLEAYLAKG